jgi:hypothetical protein
MDFHNGKIYKLSQNFYFYKANQPRLWMEYCKKVMIPNKISEPYSSIPENDERLTIESYDDLWIDIKKYL